MAAKKTTKWKKGTNCRKTAGCKKTTKNAKVTKVTKARTKTEIMNALADITELTRKDVNSVFDALTNVIKQDLGRGGPGTFTVPGLMKIRVVNKPATPARKGTNPFTGEPMTFKAKPARNVVRIRPLGNLKSMV